ncbi:MAG: hypothetical protein LIO69_07460 [Oscillospiraceae bacterium]|nr:hypothetical protein [Oscillospiraceae bacterium]
MENEEIIDTRGEDMEDSTSEIQLPDTEEGDNDTITPERSKQSASSLGEENYRLRRELFCLKRGISEELAGDVTALAEKYSAEEGISFEEAAEKVYKRLSSISRSAAGDEGKITDTGVKLPKMQQSDDSALRRAFGLA